MKFSRRVRLLLQAGQGRGVESRATTLFEGTTLFEALVMAAKRAIGRLEARSKA